MGQQTDYSIPVWEQKPSPKLARHERQRLAAQHYRMDVEFVGIEQAAVNVEPYCVSCREPWGAEGCTTVRALSVLALAEHERDEARQRVGHLTFALGELAVRGETGRSPERRVLEIHAAVDERALVLGGIGIIDATLMNLRNHFKVWFERANRDPVEGMAKALNTGLANARRARERREEVNHG